MTVQRWRRKRQGTTVGNGCKHISSVVHLQKTLQGAYESPPSVSQTRQPDRHLARLQKRASTRGKFLEIYRCFCTPSACIGPSPLAQILTQDPGNVEKHRHPSQTLFMYISRWPARPWELAHLGVRNREAGRSKSRSRDVVGLWVVLAAQPEVFDLSNCRGDK